MKKLSVNEFISPDKYEKMRNAMRQEIIAHKVKRRVHLGPNATLYFEDYMTMKYQVQEMLRIEKISDPALIEEEIEAYNPLIPDGSNLKATFMLEYEDESERKQALSQLVGIEHSIWIQVGEFEQVHPICNEDLERSTEEKTSSVHFMRFEFTPAMIAAFKKGETVRLGSDHPAYEHLIDKLPEDSQNSLINDFS